MLRQAQHEGFVSTAHPEALHPELVEGRRAQGAPYKLTSVGVIV